MTALQDSVYVPKHWRMLANCRKLKPWPRNWIGCFQRIHSTRRVYLPLISSIIERKRGNTAKAMDLLAPITQYPDLVLFYYRAQAYLEAGEHAKAVDQFKSVIARRGSPEWGIFAPLAQLGLARAYAAQGNFENSRKAYGDFFTTWKDADQDIPILRQAKIEYKKLPATASAASAPNSAESFAKGTSNKGL
jgi:predicted Zn-dependent protease